MLNILIIDDSLTIRKMLTKMFTDMSFTVVGAASSALEGISLFKKHSPDFVTMDINMPGMNGIDALKKIREIKKDANIAMLTSLGDDKLVIEALKYGAKGYILKPLDSKKIKEKMENIFPNIFMEKDDIQKLTLQNDNASIKDPLTNLYSVQYMHSTIEHLIAIHNRDIKISLGLLILNVANLDEIFTKIGLSNKKNLLNQIVAIIQKNILASDFPIQLKNNEFGVFLVGSAVDHIDILASKLIEDIEKIEINHETLKVNIGISIHMQNEDMILFLEKTDRAVREALEDENNNIYVSKENFIL